MTRVIEGSLSLENIDIEDRGMAKIGELTETTETDEFFVRLQSWSAAKTHPYFDSLVGKRLRITIETLD